MAGPWEAYQQAGPEAGPWQHYAAPKAAPQAGPWETMANTAADFFKSIPRGLATGAVNAPNASMVPMQDYEMQMGPLRQKSLDALKRDLPQPQGRAGRIGEAVGEAVGNPLTLMGPGSAALKIGGAALAGAGSEAAGQAAQGTAYEHPARIAGAFAGGAAAAKAFGPARPRAAIPTREELKAAADQGYTAARSSGVELDPAAVAQWATQQQQNLSSGPKYAFSGGQYGTAPKTFNVLDALQNPPGGAKITAGNLQTLRTNLGDIAGEVGPNFKPTKDAKAAMVLKRGLDEYLENLPGGAVVAGDADAFLRSTKQANANYAARERLGAIDTRVEQAENSANRQIAGSLDNRIKSRVGSLLDNPKSLRGFTDQEKAQVQRVNDGTPVSNFMRQAGRGGTGVVPFLGHAAIAGATGGSSLAAQAGIAAALYGAKKGAEAMTVKEANRLAEMLAKRSPLYEQRVNSLPAYDPKPAQAALIRALLGTQ